MSYLKIFIVLDFILLVTLQFIRQYFQPVAIVVPHHNLVKSIRLGYFKKIASLRPVTKHIIIIGPDHFSLNQKGIIFANTDWNLSNGLINYDAILGPLITQGILVQNGIVKNDHAIYNLLPDIKNVWPNTPVIPILIGQQSSVDNLNNLSKKIITNCSSDCILISSVDFSHYLPAYLAYIHDRFTLKQLNNLDTVNILKSEVDSPQSLYILEKFAQAKKSQSWNLFDHTNSGFISQNYDVETTTHVFGHYQPSLQKNPLDTTHTYVYSKENINPELNQDSLGPRFFYGVDEFDMNIENSTQNMIIAGFINNEQIMEYKFPLIKNGHRYLFLRPNPFSVKLNYGTTNTQP